MFAELFRFEVRYHLKQPLFWLMFFVFGLMTFGAVSSDAVSIGGSIGAVNRNAPFVIMQILMVMSVIGIFVTTAFVASAVLRDFDHGTAELFFARPIKKAHYLFGRFAGSLLISILVFVGPCLGILIGSLMPWLEPERIGPTTLGPYLFSFLVLVVPNLFFTGALFFALAAVTRSILSTYLSVVGFMTLYFISQTALGDVENERLASLVDPFGGGALGSATRYWTIIERNTAIPAFAGDIVLNRVIWVVAGALILGLAYVVFQPSREGLALRRKRKVATLVETAASEARGPVGNAPAAKPPAQDFSSSAAWSQFRHQLGLEVRSVLKGVPFLVMLAFGLFNVLGSLSVGNSMFGTDFYPVTHAMLTALQSSYTFLLIIIVTFYAGEMIWRERSLKMSEVHDAMPVPSAVPLFAKQVALWMVILIFMVAGTLATIGYQLWNGYTRLEPALYLKGLFIESTPFLLIAVLAVFLQVIANSKFIGYLLMILYMVSSIVLNALHFEHNLYQYAGAPQVVYSDMNGYGHFVQPYLWFNLYWTLFAALLLVGAVLCWVRGTGHTWTTRLALARERFSRPLPVVAAVATAAFLAVGGFIFYNTNVLNSYRPSDVTEELQASYEKTYKQYQDIAMPRIVAVRSTVAIYPRERRVSGETTYTLVNKTAQPIDEIHVSFDPRVQVDRLDLPPHTVKSADAVQGYTIYALNTPLLPGESCELTAVVRRENPGFENGGSDTSFVYNGTFFNNRQLFPSLGYDNGRELQDRNDRRKHDLPPVIRMPKIDDEAARRNTYLAADSDWIQYEATVSTDSDQIALAPGYLEREWSEGGRRFFHYTMDAPILHFYSFLSARWEVTRDTWHGPVAASLPAVGETAPSRDVAIEIYHLPEHAVNVPRMVDGIKKSLNYFTSNFSPYQHRQVRILEFPRYATFAQAFPNTIPYSEAIGFIADLTDPDSVDYVFYVTAHEVAHQWWAHQVMGANLQGSTMLSESFSQYSALMVMEKEYGREKMRRFLKYELDNYLRSRGGELVEELPLELVENQPYIHYRKGSVVLYALRDYLGEDVVNRTMAEFIRQTAYQQPPYTTSREFLALLRANTPPEKLALLTDLFETITLFENKVEKATVTKREDGKYQVDLTLATRKARSDGQGIETDIPLDDWIEVGVFAKVEGGRKDDETVLYLEKHHLTGSASQLQLVVDQPPTEVGIDPYNKLVDRNSNDNRKKVEGAGT